MEITEIKGKILGLLDDACNARHYETIAQLSGALADISRAEETEKRAAESNMFMQAITQSMQKPKPADVYELPWITDRFNNQPKEY